MSSRECERWIPVMRVVRIAVFALVLAACSRFGAVYPPRPSAPVADPAPARIVAHVSVSSAALSAALDDAVPKSAEGDFALFGGQRHYSWQRTSLDVSFSQGRLVLDARIDATVDASVIHAQFPIDLRITAEPVINTQYAVRLQSTEVKVDSSDRRLKLAESLGSVYEAIGDQVSARLKDFTYDLRPMLD